MVQSKYKVAIIFFKAVPKAALGYCIHRMGHMSQLVDRWSKILMPVGSSHCHCWSVLWSSGLVSAFMFCCVAVRYYCSHHTMYFIPFLKNIQQPLLCNLWRFCAFHRIRVFSGRSFLNISFVQVLYMQTSLKSYMQVEIRAALFHCWWNWSNSGVEAPPICSIFALFNPWKICSRNQEEC